MSIDNGTDLSGDCVVKWIRGEMFDKFRVIQKEQTLETFFEANCFRLYWFAGEKECTFPNDHGYNLLKHRVIYEGVEKKAKEWINYCGRPDSDVILLLSFFLLLRQRKHQRQPRQTIEDDKLVSIVGNGYKSMNLLRDLESKKFSKKHKEL